MTEPSVSIVILNYNGREHLSDCLGSVAKLHYPPERLEVLLVDNGSTDGSPGWVREQFPQVTVMELGQNYGFAEGNNRGAAAARGEILAFLNTDTRVDPGWLGALVAPLTDDDPSLAATASKMLDWEGRALDFPVYATLLGMPYASTEARAYRRPGDYNAPQYLLYASGGAMAIGRAVFLEAGGFDADFFMYHEDVDLGWRLWLQGYKILYVPSALVYHKQGGSFFGDRTPLYFLNERNALFTVIKNCGDAWLARLLPLLLFWIVERTGRYLQIDLAAYGLGREAARLPQSVAVSPAALAGVAAVMDVIRHLPRMLEKRAAIQARRARTDEEIATLFELPRDVFVQMMLGAEVDFTQATKLLDTFGLGMGESSLFTLHLRQLLRAQGPTAPGDSPLIDCFLYLADHTVAEAEARFGPDVLRELVTHVGVEAHDVQLLARTLAVAGSKLLADLLPEAAATARRSASAEADEDGLLPMIREAAWRDAVFYREELARRTDQLIRLLQENQERLASSASREAAWSEERDAVRAELTTRAADLEGLRTELAVRAADLEGLRTELAGLRLERDQLDAVLRGDWHAWEAAARERDEQLAQWRSREQAWAQERAVLLSARDQAAVALKEVLRSRRYRFAHRLAVSWWLATHPRYVAARGKQEFWQWLRAVLPPRVKNWGKRALFRGLKASWGRPVDSPHGGPAPAAAVNPVVAVDAPVQPAGGVSHQPKHDLIVFAAIDWHFRFQRPQQLACQFADHGHRVFYVSISFQDTPPERGVAPVIAPIRPHVYEVRLHGPSTLSVYRSRLEEAILEQCLEAFSVLQREQGIVDAVSLVQLPFWRPLVSRLRARFGWRFVYDCLDRHAGFSTNDPVMLAEEEALTRESDLVVATSRVLHEEQRTLNPQCVRIPNAADYAHFCAFVGEAPSGLQQLRRPVIGYYGAIADWFDTALIGDLARRRPQWSFVLVGSTFTADLRPLERLPNVHLPGEQPYPRLPAYLHSFDVCLIPFKRLPLTEATNPVKFYEYLSAGKPVVSVPLPELAEYAAEGLVLFAEDAAEFTDQIEHALAANSPEAVTRRMRFAEQHTWEARYLQLAEAIRQLYHKTSIIIPAHNNLHLTRLCVDSIFRHTTWPNYEIVIVDNASSDGTADYLHELAARYANVRCIFNERNAGFARAINQGIAAAGGDYLVFLNNDTIVARGWLTAMIRYLEAHPDVGMIGPATNLAGNEAKIDVDYTTVEEMEAFAERYTREHAGEALEPRMLGFFCVVIARRVLDQVGLLDERFGIGMFEDDDLSLRVRRAGYRLVCTDGAFVHHFHSATMRKFSEQEYLQLFEANRAKFEQKWGIRWTPHRYRWQRPAAAPAAAGGLPAAGS